MSVTGGVLGLSVEGLGDYNTEVTANVGYGGLVPGESIVGGSGRIGRAMKAEVASIEVTIFLDDDQDANDFVGLKDRTVTLKCVGHNVILTHADHIGIPKVDKSKNSFAAVFEGLKATEVR